MSSLLKVKPIGLDVVTAQREFITPYISVKPTFATRRTLADFSKSLGFCPGRLAESDLHTTIMYSTNECRYKDVQKTINSNRLYVAKPKEARILGEPKNGHVALVLELECERMTKQHEHLKATCSLIPSYPEYVPHVTIASDGHEKTPGLELEDCIEIYEKLIEEINEELSDKNELEFFFKFEKLYEVRN